MNRNLIVYEFFVIVMIVYFFCFVCINFKFFGVSDVENLFFIDLKLCKFVVC